MKGRGVMTKAPGWKGEVVAGDGEKGQQGDAVAAAEAVEEVGTSSGCSASVDARMASRSGRSCGRASAGGRPAQSCSSAS